MEHIDYNTALSIYLAKSPVKNWLHRCYSTSFAHGSELVESWIGPDAVGQTCKILDALVECEWIIPFKKATPTREMIFFGVGGRDSGTNTNGKDWDDVHTYSCEFGFSPNYLNEVFMGWVRNNPLEV